MDVKKLSFRIYAALTIAVLVAFFILIFTDNNIVKVIRTVLLVIWAPWTLVTSVKSEVLAKDIEKRYPKSFAKWIKFKQRLKF
jgi:hypothetical protein